VTPLHQLPPTHPLRNTLLEGARVRVSIPVPIEATDTEEQRISIRERQARGERKWTPWKTVTGWKISRNTYNQLGTLWTEHHEWQIPGWEDSAASSPRWAQ